tara:strand:- start:27 stop:365 length:339 start_codon:yes stop_codon:yes gene_type:complete
MLRGFVIITFSLFFSCSQIHEKRNENLLSDEQMIDALVEVHILESAARLYLLEGQQNDSLNLRDYYETLFHSKSYSFDAFEKSFSYYSKDPLKMEGFLDSVLIRVQMMEVTK